jgi:hypothetical protein
MSRRTRQLTYYEQPGADVSPETWQPAADDIHTLRFGYNLADVDRLARMSLGRVWGIHLDYSTRYELAWEAVAERLYAAPGDEPPGPSDLIRAGQDAIAAHVNSEQQQHGYDRATGGGMPRWAAYWHGQRPVREPEAGLIERLALWQVWPELTPGQRQAFLALAACGTRTAAAGKPRHLAEDVRPSPGSRPPAFPRALARARDAARLLGLRPARLPDRRPAGDRLGPEDGEGGPSPQAP